VTSSLAAKDNGVSWPRGYMKKPIELQGHELLLIEQKNGNEFPWFMAVLSNSRINQRLRVRMTLDAKGSEFETEISYATIESYISTGIIVEIIG
jgi:hypothetical protein